MGLPGGKPCGRAGFASKPCWRAFIWLFSSVCNLCIKDRSKARGFLALFCEALEVCERVVYLAEALGDQDQMWRALSEIGQSHVRRGTAPEGLWRLERLYARIEAE